MALTQQDITNICNQVKVDMQEVITPIERRLVQGNAKFETLEKAIADHQVALYGDHADLDRQPGVISEVQIMKKADRRVHKLAWIIVGAVIAAGAELGLSLVFHH